MRRMDGRPRWDDVTEALRLEAAGTSRKEIYCQLGNRTAPEQHALREAMRQRKWRGRRKPKLRDKIDKRTRAVPGGVTPMQQCRCDACPQSDAADNLASELAKGLGIPTSAGALLIASRRVGRCSFDAWNCR